MSNEYVPGLEQGADKSGTIECESSEASAIEIQGDVEFSKDSVTRSEILDFANEGFLLHNILTENECQCIIDEGERIGFGNIKGSNDNYRSAKRTVVQSQYLADLLWKRMQYSLEDINIEGEPHLQHIHGIPFVMQGKWVPSGLNHLFRLCRYEPGGHFAPHFDGFFERNPQERSLKTLMLYLNGDFTGGSTNFVDERQTLHMDESGKYCAEDKNIIERIQPETGMAIIFNHHRLHEGQQLRDNKKYILRTDVMYTKVDGGVVSEIQVKAHALLREAETLEAHGQCMEAATLYRKAFKLCPEVENSY